MIKRKLLKKLIFVKIIFILILISQQLNASIKIEMIVGEKIITSFDIKQESEYLKILNPDIKNLKKEKVLKISRDSLIKEIIKNNEIKKLKNQDIDETILSEYLKNFFQKLNFKNEEEFKIFLDNNNFLTFDEIKNRIKTDLLWNNLIYIKFIDQVKINEELIAKKIKKLSDKTVKEFFLSEIYFTKKKNLSVEELIKEINNSINEIGFSNTANIYSQSDSSNYGGRVGWISENNLSKKVLEILNITEIGKHTGVIKFNNFFLILKVEDVRKQNIKINEKLEFENLVKFETNEQLNKFSKIYFNKLKMNTYIDEK